MYTGMIFLTLLGPLLPAPCPLAFRGDIGTSDSCLVAYVMIVIFVALFTSLTNFPFILSFFPLILLIFHDFYLLCKLLCKLGLKRHCDI